MAVPKKRRSKAKKNTRKSNWKRKAFLPAQKSFCLASAFVNQKTRSFVYFKDSLRNY